MLRFLTAGESHPPALTVIIEGFPAGMPIDFEAVNRELARWQQGSGRGARMYQAPMKRFEHLFKGSSPKKRD